MVMNILGRKVEPGDVLELQFVRAADGRYIARSDEGIIIVIDDTHPIWVRLRRERPPAIVIKAKIKKIVTKPTGQQYAIALPLSDF